MLTKETSGENGIAELNDGSDLRKPCFKVLIVLVSNLAPCNAIAMHLEKKLFRLDVLHV